MKIKVKTIKNECHEIDVEPTETVAELKNKVEAKTSTPAANQKLIFSGKVLADADPLANYKIKENDFIVLYVKAPVSQPVKVEQPQEKVTTPQPQTAPSTTTQNTETPSSSLVTGEEYEQMVMQLMELGFERDQVVKALDASFRNPDRAAQYLFSGGEIPSMGGEGGMEEPSTGDNEEEGEEDDNPFGPLRNHPVFNQLRQHIQQNPQDLQPILQQLAQVEPRLIQMINENQEAFFQFVYEPITTPVAPLGTGGGMGGQVDVTVTNEEKDAIDRLCALGFPRQKVIEAFLLCDRDEQVAANYLFDSFDKGQ